MGIMSGLASITTEAIGKKVGLSIFGSLLSSPVSFFAARGLEELFGTQQGKKLDSIIHELNNLDNKISAGFDEDIKEDELTKVNESTTRLDTQMGNILQAVKSENGDVTSAASKVYEAFIEDNTGDLINEIFEDAVNVHYILCGIEKDGGSSLLQVSVDSYYRENIDIKTFYDRINKLSQKAITAFIQAIYIEAIIMSCASLALHRDTAASHIHKIGTLYHNFLNNLSRHLRDIPYFIENSMQDKFMLHNNATGQVLGRYAELSSASERHHPLFELKDHGEGYYYLKVVYNKDIGIDHYYGKEIKRVQKSDSGHPNHIWKFEPRDGWFSIVNRATGKCLDHYYGESIESADVSDHPNRLWQVLPDKSGRYCYIINKATGAMLGYESKHHKIDAFDAKYTVDVGLYNSGLILPSKWQSAEWILNNQESNYHNLLNSMSGEAVDHYDGESFRFVNSPSGHPNHCWRFESTAVDLAPVIKMPQESVNNYTFQEQINSSGDNTWKLVIDDSNTDQEEDNNIDSTKAYLFIRNKASNQVLDHYYGKSLKGANDLNALAPHPNHIWQVKFV